MKLVVTCTLLCLVMLLTGCAKNIDDVKSEEYVGEEVRVKGVVKNTVKIGGVSGYTLESDKGSIVVSSEELPKEGETKTVRGVIRQATLLGYYLEVS